MKHEYGYDLAELGSGYMSLRKFLKKCSAKGWNIISVTYDSGSEVYTIFYDKGEENAAD